MRSMSGGGHRPPRPLPNRPPFRGREPSEHAAPLRPLHRSYLLSIFLFMVFSPSRSAISHAPRARKPTPDDPCIGPGRKGRPHSDAKVNEVRRLIETTTYSYRSEE